MSEVDRVRSVRVTTVDNVPHYDFLEGEVIENSSQTQSTASAGSNGWSRPAQIPSAEANRVAEHLARELLSLLQPTPLDRARQPRVLGGPDPSQYGVFAAAALYEFGAAFAESAVAKIKKENVLALVKRIAADPNGFQRGYSEGEIDGLTLALKNFYNSVADLVALPERLSRERSRSASFTKHWRSGGEHTFTCGFARCYEQSRSHAFSTK